ncbi:galactose-1-phosphate uridylyltransferase [Dokdonia pacifica]|uniref:Galactose-1-phosphate uridylyltransferase n=1 Tax=Dokdonia pacifica TaxID=1627892 RepID=A0A239BLE9_9FLAO|nr:UDP-glucose--hexose-1-phosphate uridylyltransferase [Dokdonia pacifica]GGG28787.1 galactose-1-phosphate uridylyltransferase [Dokdonia pacifica]SNS08696.1 UDPglucose--hexose-1-phosphate uridylyltransferase [Dokdonia pacifica]
MASLQEQPHRRFNILTGEWILVSPHRTKRPWQGKNEEPSLLATVAYDKNCYLCPGNERAGGVVNPDYKAPYAFTNDFAALLSDTSTSMIEDGLLQAKGELGECRVVCFSENHSLTLPLMEVKNIIKVISLWQDEYDVLGNKQQINHVQIFENKGAIMGCSNPHPHGQIWSQSTIPEEVIKKTERQLSYWKKNNRSLLEDYIKQELQAKERIIFQNEHFVILVPYWAIWPYETMIIPKRKVTAITGLTEEEKKSFAEAIKRLTIKYDNIFQTSFPYSSGIHQAPTDGKEYSEWHMHMSFYPPLLRSATVKKFMVGYELFANPQRDITAEQAAATIRDQSEIHYTHKAS